MDMTNAKLVVNTTQKMDLLARRVVYAVEIV